MCILPDSNPSLALDLKLMKSTLISCLACSLTCPMDCAFHSKNSYGDILDMWYTFRPIRKRCLLRGPPAACRLLGYHESSVPTPADGKANTRALCSSSSYFLQSDYPLLCPTCELVLFPTPTSAYPFYTYFRHVRKFHQPVIHLVLITSV